MRPLPSSPSFLFHFRFVCRQVKPWLGAIEDAVPVPPFYIPFPLPFLSGLTCQQARGRLKYSSKKGGMKGHHKKDHHSIHTKHIDIDHHSIQQRLTELVKRKC